jgi:hypothetical protein
MENFEGSSFSHGNSSSSLDVPCGIHEARSENEARASHLRCGRVENGTHEVSDAPCNVSGPAPPLFTHVQRERDYYFFKSKEVFLR